MRRTINRILAILTTALLAFVTSGCVEPLDNNVPGIDPDAVYLPIRLYIPGAIPATKVSPTSDITGLTDNSESQIHCVQVWMFSHGGPDTESAVAYAEAGTLTGQTSNLPNGSGYYNQPYDPGQNAQNTLDWSKGYWENEYTYKLSMRIPKRILQGNNLKFDFYVLANAKSIGTTTLQAMTRGELKESMFGGGASDDFGTTSPVTEVGTNGLPISGFFNKGSNTETAANASGVDLSFLKEDKVFTLADFYENLPIVQLERAVSRIRFSFAKPTGMTGVQIIKVEIDGNQIPTSTYVFPRENGQFPAETEYEYPTDVGYVPIFQGTAATETTPATPFLSDTQIKSYENPEDLKSTSNKIFNVTGKSYNGKAPLGTSTETTMNSQQYNDLLDDYTTSTYVYLRESGEPIKGRITYSLDGGTTTKTADFFMKPPTGSNPENPYDYPNTTNFYRNHSWTVYGYFNGGVTLEIWPYAFPWIYNELTTTFSSQVQCDGISVTGAIENTSAYMNSHPNAQGEPSSNHYLSNGPAPNGTGEVPSTTDDNYYDKYYQVRRLDHSADALGYFEFKFTPRAPYGGYWMLEPEFFGPNTDHGGPSDMFLFEVQLADGATSSSLEGQIIDREVTIRIRPSSNYDYANDLNSYSVIFKSYFSPTRNFDPSYSADSELQDVHSDGRYSYWRFTLTHGDW